MAGATAPLVLTLASSHSQTPSRYWPSDNTFYRRSGQGIVVSGGRELRTGDVALLGHDTIHAVQNPRQAFTGAIHVYGGDITARSGRSEWEEDNGQEVDYDFERVRRYFAAFQAPAPTT